MVLTSEGALLAAGLAALVVGLIGAWALLSAAVRRPGRGAAPREVGKPRQVRRTITPAGTAPKV